MELGRKIVDAADARRCLTAAKRAGKSAGEWARSQGIDGRSLHAWSVNLQRGRAAKALTKRSELTKPTSLVELVPRAIVGNPRARYVLEVNGVRVEFDDEASPVMLRRVVEELRSC